MRYGYFYRTLFFAALLLVSGCKDDSPSPLATLSGPGFGPETFGPTGSGSTSNSNGSGTEGGESGEINFETLGGTLDGGQIPLEDFIFCGSSGQIVLKPNQQTTLTWRIREGFEFQQALTLSLENNAGVASMGMVAPSGLLQALYTAPPEVENDFIVNIVADVGAGNFESVCAIRLIPADEIGVEDDGVSRGLVGYVFDLGGTISQLPDFALYTPIQEILVPNLDVPTRSFSEGFPGVRDLIEWFGVAFEGTITLPEGGLYEFRLNSDDGANLYINTDLVVDNDGVHAPRARNGSIVLPAGTYPIVVDYFQGPRYHITLQLSWKTPGSSTFEIIPPDYFGRPE